MIYYKLGKTYLIILVFKDKDKGIQISLAGSLGMNLQVPCHDIAFDSSITQFISNFSNRRIVLDI